MQHWQSRACIAALVMAIATPAAAAAQPVSRKDSANSVQVDYADLDMSNARDANRLLNRIRRAARNVCDRPTRMAPGEMREYRLCVGETVDTAVADIASPVLTARHLERGGRAPARLALAETIAE